MACSLEEGIVSGPCYLGDRSGGLPFHKLRMSVVEGVKKGGPWLVLSPHHPASGWGSSSSLGVFHFLKSYSHLHRFWFLDHPSSPGFQVRVGEDGRKQQML